METTESTGVPHPFYRAQVLRQLRVADGCARSSGTLATLAGLTQKTTELVLTELMNDELVVQVDEGYQLV